MQPLSTRSIVLAQANTIHNRLNGMKGSFRDSERGVDAQIITWTLVLIAAVAILSYLRKFLEDRRRLARALEQGLGLDAALRETLRPLLSADFLRSPERSVKDRGLILSEVRRLATDGNRELAAEVHRAWLGRHRDLLAAYGPLAAGERVLIKTSEGETIGEAAMTSVGQEEATLVRFDENLAGIDLDRGATLLLERARGVSARARLEDQEAHGMVWRLAINEAAQHEGSREECRVQPEIEILLQPWDDRCAHFRTEVAAEEEAASRPRGRSRSTASQQAARTRRRRTVLRPARRVLLEDLSTWGLRLRAIEAIYDTKAGESVALYVYCEVDGRSHEFMLRATAIEGWTESRHEGRRVEVLRCRLLDLDQAEERRLRAFVQALSTRHEDGPESLIGAYHDSPEISRRRPVLQL